MTNSSKSNFKREKGCTLKTRSGNKGRPVALVLLYRVKTVPGRKICKHVNTWADAFMIQLPDKLKEWIYRLHADCDYVSFSQNALSKTRSWARQSRSHSSGVFVHRVNLVFGESRHNWWFIEQLYKPVLVSICQLSNSSIFKCSSTEFLLAVQMPKKLHSEWYILAP